MRDIHRGILYYAALLYLFSSIRDYLTHCRDLREITVIHVRAARVSVAASRVMHFFEGVCQVWSYMADSLVVARRGMSGVISDGITEIRCMQSLAVLTCYASGSFASVNRMKDACLILHSRCCVRLACA